MEVLAQEGDTVDSLCWHHLGSSAPVVAVLELNPGLAALGPILPYGTPVKLPATAPAKQNKTLIQLWD